MIERRTTRIGMAAEHQQPAGITVTSPRTDIVIRITNLRLAKVAAVARAGTTAIAHIAETNLPRHHFAIMEITTRITIIITTTIIVAEEMIRSNRWYRLPQWNNRSAGPPTTKRIAILSDRNATWTCPWTYRSARSKLWRLMRVT